MKNVTPLNSAAITPEMLIDWLQSEIDKGTCEQVLIAVKHNIDSDTDFFDFEAMGRHSDILWLASWLRRSIERSYFG